MKKSLLVLALSAVVSSMSANLIEIENMTKRHLTVKVTLAGFDCIGNNKSRMDFKMTPKEMKQITIPNCCIAAMDITAQPYGQKGIVLNVGTPLTMIVCPPVSRFKVLEDINGSIIIKRMVYQQRTI